MGLMQDETYCLNVVVYNLFEYRQPNQFVVCLTPHFKLLERQCQISEHQVSILLSYLLYDDVQVVFCVQFRGQDIKLHFVSDVLACNILVCKFQGKVSWLIKEINIAVYKVFPRCQMDTVEHLLHLFVRVDDTRFLLCIKECQR